MTMGEYTNTRLVREMLSEGGFMFSTPPAAATGAGGSDTTSLSFGDSESGPWTFFILSFRNAAVLRFYSYVGQAYGSPQRILELINYINATYLFESSLDYHQLSNIIRYKGIFRGVGIGLPAFEAKIAMEHHMSCSTYLHNLLYRALRTYESNPELAINGLIPEINNKLNLTTAPYFP
ncbi:hypothetical protein [Burkholderia lata]|uniref:hypothetical protein n=1 Tax=Burkholderia lata (strain ATCC 17760 / DSM 23089 / LMG 22485 / NCIMB 9086 / R18194 / 383) TaxID=482957 RepID=UPI001582F42A|nr:hypothetical protein [Burkholderia lata]